MPESITAIAHDLADELDALTFASPVAYVYNPLAYARRSHDLYLRRFGKGTRRVILLGMNPGPWGMAQTGVPFGEVTAVRDWLGIIARVDPPAKIHPKRPVLGLDCQRSEVSGARLWGWAREQFGQPDAFFRRFFVANYCPLMFLDSGGRNLTPDKLPAGERQSVQRICDHAFRRLIEVLRPRIVVGVGKYAERRAREAIQASGSDLLVDSIPHPSPANPSANRGWAKLVTGKLLALAREDARKCNVPALSASGRC